MRIKGLIRRLVAASDDPERFWREWHDDRRAKRLVELVLQRQAALDKVASLERLIAFYEDKLTGAK